MIATMKILRTPFLIPQCFVEKILPNTRRGGETPPTKKTQNTQRPMTIQLSFLDKNSIEKWKTVKANEILSIYLYIESWSQGINLIGLEISLQIMLAQNLQRFLLLHLSARIKVIHYHAMTLLEFQKKPKLECSVHRLLPD